MTGAIRPPRPTATVRFDARCADLETRTVPRKLRKSRKAAVNLVGLRRSSESQGSVVKFRVVLGRPRPDGTRGRRSERPRWRTRCQWRSTFPAPSGAPPRRRRWRGRSPVSEPLSGTLVRAHAASWSPLPERDPALPRVAQSSSDCDKDCFSAAGHRDPDKPPQQERGNRRYQSQGECRRRTVAGPSGAGSIGGSCER
jgi:hypothetical protein